MSYYAVQTILINQLDMRHCIARWVPKLLTHKQMKACMDICSELLRLCSPDESSFIDQIVMGDESWFHFYEPETKQQSSQLIA